MMIAQNRPGIKYRNGRFPLLIVIASCALAALAGCRPKLSAAALHEAVRPVAVTDKVVFDTDDPAIWIDAKEPGESLIIGTDKERGGGLYAFDLKGRIVRKVLGLDRPNNVDIAYGLQLGGRRVDIAVATERTTNKLRFYSLPDLTSIDNGGLEVFVGEDQRLPMGIALYTSPADGSIYAIVGRKSGPGDGYLWQYKLIEEQGKLAMQLVRKFGKYSGIKEIESIAVDNELGYIYYSDEQVGIRKYYADPAKGNEELAMFGQGQFKEDNEGISIYKFGDGTGYILVSDQSAGRFNLYPREGMTDSVNTHPLLVSIPVSTIASDGSEVTSTSLPGFPGGLFVAMSDDRTFQIYRWVDLAKQGGLRTLK